MRISLGRGIGRTISIGGVTRVTLYRVFYDDSVSDWETPKELIDYIQSLFGPGIKDV